MNSFMPLFQRYLAKRLTGKSAYKKCVFSLRCEAEKLISCFEFTILGRTVFVSIKHQKYCQYLEY